MTTEKRRQRGGAVDAVPCLEGLVGRLTLGKALWAIRECEEWSLAEMGRRLGVGRAHLCDIEKGRRVVSPERAARWARTLGYDEGQMVELALQALIDNADLSYAVTLKPAKRVGKPRRRVGRVA